MKQIFTFLLLFFFHSYSSQLFGQSKLLPFQSGIEKVEIKAGEYINSEIIIQNHLKRTIGRVLLEWLEWESFLQLIQLM